MANWVRKLQKHGVMTLLTLVVIGMNIGCEDRIDSPMVNTPEGEPMTVTLNVDLADEADGASLYPNASTKANKGEAFSAQLLPTTHTKADTKPTSLYNLEIRQYDSNGKYMNGKSFGATTDIGSSLTLTLTASDQCRLVIIARGEDNTVKELGNKSFSEVQSVLADTATIKSISTTDGTNMNKMPYILYLPNVKVVDNTIQSPDGTDVRLRLKRLAVKLSLNWMFGEDMTKKGYILNEVRLFQVPADYRILPAPESTPKWGTVYPSSVSNFIDGYRLKGEELTKANGTRTIWMPANAQGSSSAIAYPNLRSKARVNPATTYAEFVVDNAQKQERFYYRVYLGGNITTDFNLLENTDYNWTVNINSVKYTTDDRISMLDQTPVISTNLQPTTNCFMMQPGTNICFNPYKHEAGAGGWNTELTSGGTISKTIKKVKVLWQNKDTGTSGELVLGYAISESNHQNLVNLTDGNHINNARIHIKVPNTSGGNAVIAAYGDDETKALWSWHIWISDYVPATLGSFTSGDATARANAIADAQNVTQGGMVHTYQGESWTSSTGNFYKKVIMDRNLGAIRGVPAPNSSLESARTYGVLYQWGRKDPMPGSADGSYKEINTIFDADGATISLNKSANGDLQKSIANPSTFYYDTYFVGNSWGPETKTIYDPCPKGWKVPDFYPGTTSVMFDGFAFSSNLALLNNQKWTTTAINQSSAKINATNGLLYLYPGETYAQYTSKSVWFPMYWMRERDSGILRHTDACFVMFSAHESEPVQGFPTAYYTEVKAYGNLMFTRGRTAVKSYGMSVRCIQN